MSGSKRPRNWFYALAMLFGLAFTLTACSFGVLILHANRPAGSAGVGPSGERLLNLLDQHGTAILVCELVGLAIFTVAAIRVDHVRGMRDFAERSRGEKQPRDDQTS
jgi:hypothetical protein